MNFKNNNILISLLISLSFCVVYLFLFDFIRYNQADTINFVNATKILFGNSDVVDTQSRITKPVVLLLPGIINYIFNIKIETVMLWQNILLFISTGLLLGKLISIFNFNNKFQYLGIFIFYTIQPIAVHSLELINDIAGYFFSILILYLYFLWQKQPQLSIKQYIILATTIILGILSKESAGLAVLVIIADSVVNFSPSKRIKNFILLFASASIIFAIQWFINTYYHTTSIVINVVEEFYLNNGFSIKFEQIIHSFDTYWLFVALGIYYLIKNINTYSYSKLLLFAGAVSVPVLFLWATVQDRTISVIAPLFVIYIIYAIKNLKLDKLYFPLVIVAGILNISITYLIYKYNISNLLKYYLVIFSIVFFISLVFKNKRIFNK